MKSIIIFDLYTDTYDTAGAFLQNDRLNGDRLYKVTNVDGEIARHYVDDGSEVDPVVSMEDLNWLGFSINEDGTPSPHANATVYDWETKDHTMLEWDKIKHLDPIGYIYKQVIVIRKDLKMRRGKECAQVAHASMKATLENMEDERVKLWLSAAFAKICVCVNSEQELLDVYKQAKEAGLITAIIKDHGRTEFGGVKTFTTVAIGPGLIEDIDAVTKDLKLY